MDPSFEVQFTQDGLHVITLEGTIEDIWGNTWSGGGTYEIHVARMLSLDTTVLPGTPFEVGDIFNSGLVLTPPVAADIEVHFRLAPNSEASQMVERKVRGRANRFGYFHPAASGFVLNQPGEYRVDVTASFRDEQDTLWMGARTWGGVVAPRNPAIIAHGRRGVDDEPVVGQQWFFRTDTGIPIDTSHVPFPFHSGDIMWLQESDSAIPMVTFQDPGGSIMNLLRNRALDSGGFQQVPLQLPRPFDDQAAVGEIPLFSSRSDGFDSHLDPSQVDLWGYSYQSVQRPLVRVREEIGEDAMAAPYWRFNDQYAGQFGVGRNGDLTNDFKFQYGAVVLRGPALDTPHYAIHGSLFVLVPDDDPNGGTRTFPPFQGNGGGPSGGPIFTLQGRDIDIFFHPTGTRPGSILEVGDIASFAGHIGPTLPSRVEITVTAPSGQVREVTGQANKVGYFYDPSGDFMVQESGPYRAQVEVWHDGLTSAGPVQEPFPKGDVLGSNDGEFFFYVVEKEAGDLGVDVPRTSFVQPADGPIQIPILPGEQPPDDLEVHFTTVMPGFLLEQGTISASPSTGLVYSYDAPRLHEDFPNLDLHDNNNRTGADTIVMRFLLSGNRGGERVYQARQVVLQGEELLALPHSLAPTIALVLPTDASAGTRIQITGTRFLEGDLEILFDGVSGIDIEVVDGSTILVTVPELPSAGPVTITVKTDEGSVTLTDGLVVEEATFGLANLLFTQFANGEIETLAAADWEAPQGSIPNRTRIILINNSDEADSGVVRFRDAAGNPIPVQVGGIATDTLSYSLDPWSTTELETDGTGDLQTGTIEVISSRGEESRLEGTEAFEILGNFVSVVSSPRRSSQQIYVSLTETENTGVALLNPDQENPVTVDTTLLDSHNEEKADREILLEGGQQLVAFVDQADLFADFFTTQDGDFQGRLKLTARDDRDLALLGLLQKRATAALIAISTESEADPGRLIFTQFANGVLAAATASNYETQQGGTDARTRLILINDGEETDTGTIRFQNAGGQPTAVPIQGESTDTVDYFLDGGTTAEVETDGTGALQSGVIEVNSDLEADSRIVGSEVFEILGNFVSVTNSPPRSSQQAYVSVTAEENTGVALYNPDSQNAVVLTLILVDSEGNERAQKQVMLDPAQQLVQFVDQSELFADFFAAQEEDFKGTLNIHAEEGNQVAVLGLLQKRASGALIAVSTSPNAFGRGN